MFFGDGTLEKPKVHLRVCSAGDNTKTLSQFRFKDQSLICNVCQTRTFSLREAVEHWKLQQCTPHLPLNNDNSGHIVQGVELRPELLEKKVLKNNINHSENGLRNEGDEYKSEDDEKVDTSKEADSDFEEDQEDVDMEIKPEIYSDEDYDDSKFDVKDFLDNDRCSDQDDDDDQNYPDDMGHEDDFQLDGDEDSYQQDSVLDIDPYDENSLEMGKEIKQEQSTICDIKEKKPALIGFKKKDKVPGGKEFVCEFDGCGYTANYQTLLRRHIKHVHELRRYNCAFCDLRGIGVDGLRKHVKKHHEGMTFSKDDHPMCDPSEVRAEQTFSCDIGGCQFTAPNRWTLRDHKETAHSDFTKPTLMFEEKMYYQDGDEYVCKYCNYRSKLQGTTRIHIERLHGIRTCFHCDFQCNDIQALKDHVTIQHGGQDTRCDYCTKTFLSKEGLNKHVKLIHEEHVNPNAELLFCDKCSYSGYGKFRLRRHIRSVHTMSEMKCEFCTKTFKSIEGLQKHEKLIHEEEVNPGGELLYCDKCDYSVQGEYRLKQHMRYSHRDESSFYKCDKCDFKSHNRNNLQRHYNSIHLGIKNRKRIEKCSLCGFPCEGKHKLQKHLQAVHNSSLELVYCDQCTFSSHYKTSLSNHKRMKHGPGPVLTTLAKPKTHYCEYCEFTCKTKPAMTAHVNSKHLGIKFYCEVCDYSCSSAQMLGWHTQGKHGGGYPCPHCSYRATQPGQLSLHIKAIHEKVKFSCDLCPFSTSFKTNLNAHIRKCH